MSTTRKQTPPSRQESLDKLEGFKPEIAELCASLGFGRDMYLPIVEAIDKAKAVIAATPGLE